jgi:DNA-directed RNA polymerase specialized sigma24 family protein
VEISNRPSSAEDWALNPKITELLRAKARRAAKLPGFTISDVPDIKQDLWLHVLKRMSCYDPCRSSPETFASRLADNYIASMARASRALKRSGTSSVASIDQTNGTEGFDTAVSQLIDDASRRRRLGVVHTADAKRSDIRLDLRHAIGSSPPMLQKLAALLSHVPQFAAGEVLGLSRRRTAALMAKLREVLTASDFAPDVQIPPPWRM